MIIRVCKSDYLIPQDSQVSPAGDRVIIDIPDRDNRQQKMYTSRLVIVFDQARTARFFSTLIRDSLAAGKQYLEIHKLQSWNPQYPFGYSYR